MTKPIKITVTCTCGQQIPISRSQAARAMQGHRFTSEQARAAITKRWANRKTKND